MARKFSKKIEDRARLLKIADISGWLLIAPDESDGDEWHIAWPWDVFGTKRKALSFAKTNGWPGPYRAVRGCLTVHQ